MKNLDQLWQTGIIARLEQMQYGMWMNVCLPKSCQMLAAYDYEFDNFTIFSEVKRVLRPGGLYLFVEHVAAKGI